MEMKACAGVRHGASAFLKKCLVSMAAIATLCAVADGTNAIATLEPQPYYGKVAQEVLKWLSFKMIESLSMTG